MNRCQDWICDKNWEIWSNVWGKCIPRTTKWARRKKSNHTKKSEKWELNMMWNLSLDVKINFCCQSTQWNLQLVIFQTWHAKKVDFFHIARYLLEWWQSFLEIKDKYPKMNLQLCKTIKVWVCMHFKSCHIPFCKIIRFDDINIHWKITHCSLHGNVVSAYEVRQKKYMHTGYLE